MKLVERYAALRPGADGWSIRDELIPTAAVPE